MVIKLAAITGKAMRYQSGCFINTDINTLHFVTERIIRAVTSGPSFFVQAQFILFIIISYPDEPQFIIVIIDLSSPAITRTHRLILFIKSPQFLYLAIGIVFHRSIIGAINIQHRFSFRIKATLPNDPAIHIILCQKAMRSIGYVTWRSICTKV